MPASRFIANRFTLLAGLLRFVFCAAVLLAPLSAGRAGVEAAAPEDAPATRALILLDAGLPIDAAAAQIAALGGGVDATFPERALYVLLNAAQAEAVRRLPGVAAVFPAAADVAPLPLELAGEDAGARAALLAWNAALPAAQSSTAQAAPSDLPALPDNPVRLPPDRFPQAFASQAQAGGQEPGPDATQTSEYMLGSVQVDVFLPESNGLLDPQSETWTPEQVDRVLAKVTQGVSWWTETARMRRAAAGRPAAADLIPNIVFHTPFNAAGEVSTRYEPVSRPSWEEGLWIGEILGRMGYEHGGAPSDAPGAYFSAARRYAHDRRTAFGRDWGFSIFVVNSAADVDGRFANGYFGYSYLFGPFVVMTSDNNGWGLDSMDIVTAHEMGHIFGALDEYGASGCTHIQTSGYLNIANTNCETGGASQDSIMRSAISQRIAYPNHLVSTPVQGMLGWRDLDVDGLYDPVDTRPAVSLDPEAAGGGWVVSGAAADIPWASKTHRDASINPIVRVEFRLPGGEWQACQAADGGFNALQEAYICPLADGESPAIQVRAVNRVGMAATESRGDFASYKVYLPAAISH